MPHGFAGREGMKFLHSRPPGGIENSNGDIFSITVDHQYQGFVESRMEVCRVRMCEVVRDVNDPLRVDRAGKFFTQLFSDEWAGVTNLNLGVQNILQAQ